MIRIIAIGKIKETYLVNMVEDYFKRINKYHRLEILEVSDSNPKEEAEKILSKIENNGFNIALSINGKKLNSLTFAKELDQNLMRHAKINFIIGGSNGLSEVILKIVNEQISFGDLTFPHGLFRAILLEQIYRGFKIINNESYHK